MRPTICPSCKGSLDDEMMEGEHHEVIETPTLWIIWCPFVDFPLDIVYVRKENAPS